MKTIQIYDRPMCCSTGICGPSVDPVLPRFAADLDKMKTAGHAIERYNLAQQPQAFIQNAAIHALISAKGPDVLLVVIVDGRIVSRGIYPLLICCRCGAVAQQDLPSKAIRFRSLSRDAAAARPGAVER